MNNRTKFTMLLLCLLTASSIYTQSTVPQGMRYQAVARDLAGNPLGNQHISLLIGLRAGAAEGKLMYEETHSVTTDAGGLFAVTVGGGSVSFGDFNRISWSNADMWLTVALDDQGGNNFEKLTASQLWAVPYAFHAATADGYAVMETDIAEKPCGATGIPFWTNLGNTNVSDTCHFIGTVYEVDFILKTNNTERMRITKEGKIQMHGLLEVKDLHVEHDADVDHNLTVNNRLVINAGMTGNDHDINSYPVLVKGGNQGVAVKVSGTGTTANNFVSFWDDNGMKGRIEGQTEGEVLSSFDYIWETTMMGVQVGFLAAEAACTGSQLDFCEAALLAAQAITLGTEWGVKTAQMVSDAGIAFESGSGDYAEWLEKTSPADVFAPGEVVGVHGGRISRQTDRADHIMVVSTSPIVLGNMPEAGRQDQYEKIAFLGQVPVRVMGKVEVGDYLLASGHHDGYAVAVNPARMRIEDYRRIVGVAWEASATALGGMVNTAVGINANDVANQMAQQQRELDILKQQVNLLYTRVGLPEPNIVQAEIKAEQVPAEPASPMLTKEEMLQWLENNRSVFESSMARTRAHLEQQGTDINKFPEIAAIYADPVQFLKNQLEKGYLNGMMPGMQK